MRHPQLSVYELGVVPYRAAWALQERLHQRCVVGELGASVLLLEHPAVLTLGRHAKADDDLLVSRAELERRGVELLTSERGGQITAHMPGQLVVYPILPLVDFGLGVRQYVSLLEQSVVATLAHYGVSGECHPAYPGVWVGTAKICALGVRIKQRVSMHGLALNVCNELGLFEAIVPCGLRGRQATSLQQLWQGGAIALPEVGRVLTAELSKRLGVQVYEIADKTCLEMRI